MIFSSTVKYPLLEGIMRRAMEKLRMGKDAISGVEVNFEEQEIFLKTSGATFEVGTLCSSVANLLQVVKAS